MEKLYLYIRLSSADDDLKFKTESESIANQRTLLYQYIRSHREFDRYEVTEFVDDGYSGTNGNRPSFERMIENLKNGEAHVVMCKDFSRFFRDYVEIGDYLERIFPFLGVRFIAVNDGYDSDEYKGSTAGMEVVMKYIVYAYYSKDLSQKLKSVLSSRKGRGEFIASQAPYGYMKDSKSKRRMAINPDTAPIVRRIFDLAMQGYKSTQIAILFNDEHIEAPGVYFMRTHPESKRYRGFAVEDMKWTATNIRAIIRRREYTGAMVANKRIWKGIDSPHTLWKDESEWKIIPNCHEAIVTEEEFEQAQAAIRTMKKIEKRPVEYLLRSLIRCGNCGRIMRRQSTCKRVYYSCQVSRADRETKCPIGERFYEDELERIIGGDLIEKLQLLVEADEHFQKVATSLEGTEENLRFRLEQTEKRLKQISLSRIHAYEQYTEGKLSRDMYLIEKEKLGTEADTLAADKERLEQELIPLSQSQNRELRDTADQAREILAADQLTNEMLLMFIDRVNVFSGMRVEIIYRFSDTIAEVIKA